ncbi:MAG: AbrB/MazE/SpoVT family DNA-binding domain-containing protein [Hyphomicrobiales bacterium]
MRITTKGQVTIPKPVRDRAGITPYSELDVRYEDGKVVIEKVEIDEAEKRRRLREFEEWLARFKGSADAGLTTDEIMEMTRGPFDDVDPR